MIETYDIKAIVLFCIEYFVSLYMSNQVLLESALTFIPMYIMGKCIKEYKPRVKSSQNGNEIMMTDLVSPVLSVSPMSPASPNEDNGGETTGNSSDHDIGIDLNLGDMTPMSEKATSHTLDVPSPIATILVDRSSNLSLESNNSINSHSNVNVIGTTLRSSMHLRQLSTAKMTQSANLAIEKLLDSALSSNKEDGGENTAEEEGSKDKLYHILTLKQDDIATCFDFESDFVIDLYGDGDGDHDENDFQQQQQQQQQHVHNGQSSQDNFHHNRSEHKNVSQENINDNACEEKYDKLELNDVNDINQDNEKMNGITPITTLSMSEAGIDALQFENPNITHFKLKSSSNSHPGSRISRGQRHRISTHLSPRSSVNFVKLEVMKRLKERLYNETYPLPHMCKYVSIVCIIIWSVLCACITTIWCIWFEMELKLSNFYQNKIDGAGRNGEYIELETMINYNQTQKSMNDAETEWRQNGRSMYNPPKGDSFGVDTVAARFLLSVFLSYFLSVFLWQPLLLALKSMKRLKNISDKPDRVNEALLFYNEIETPTFGFELKDFNEDINSGSINQNGEIGFGLSSYQAEKLDERQP